jgi:uncharacterized protein YifE (UPF0438 family)
MRSEHKKYLTQEFEIDHRLVDAFDPSEIEILKTYGSWFRALSSSFVSTFTESQEHFVAVCSEADSPRTNYEVVWQKYILEEKYISAIDMDRRLQGGQMSNYEAVKAKFEELAKKGHLGAISWLDKENSTIVSDSEEDEEYDDLMYGGSADNKQTGFAPGPSSIQPDWSTEFDDMGASEWEEILGGPDE